MCKEAYDRTRDQLSAQGFSNPPPGRRASAWLWGVLLLALLLGPASVAWAQNPLANRWASPEHFQEAKLKSRGTGQLVAVIYATNGPEIVAGNNEMLGHRAFNNCLRVGAWAFFNGLTGEGTPTDKAARSIITLYNSASSKDDGRIPRVYLLAANGRLINTILSSELSKADPLTAQATQINAWYSGIDDGVLRVESNLIQGRFKAALSFMERVLKEDVEASKVINDNLQTTFDPTKHPGTSDDATFWAEQMETWQAEVDKIQAEIDEANAAGKTGRSKRMPTRPAFDADVFDTQSDPDVPGATFFPKLLSSKKRQYDQIAKSILTDARELHAQGKTQQAIAMIQPMVRDGADLPAINDAKSQLDQWSPPATNPPATKK